MHHMCANTKKIAEQGPLALAMAPGEVEVLQGVYDQYMEIILLWKFPYMVIRQHALWAG